MLTNEDTLQKTDPTSKTSWRRFANTHKYVGEAFEKLIDDGLSAIFCSYIPKSSLTSVDEIPVAARSYGHPGSDGLSLKNLFYEKGALYTRDSILYGDVTGDPIWAIVIYNTRTRDLIAVEPKFVVSCGTESHNPPCVPNGGDIVLTWSKYGGLLISEAAMYEEA